MGKVGSRVALVSAAVLVTGLERWIPAGRWVLYPFILLTTWVHEMGHGLTAMALGGKFERLEIFADASGVAFTTASPGFSAALVALGGLLAPPLLAALILAFARGSGRAYFCLMALSFGLGASLVFWVRSFVGIVAVPGLALVLALGANVGGGRLRLLAAQLVAVVLGLDTVTRMLHYVFIERVQAGATAGGRSDVGAVADNLGGPYWFWGAMVAAVALLLLLWGLRAAFRGGVAPKSAEGELDGDADAELDPASGAPGRRLRP
jgi:hypothetical protein